MEGALVEGSQGRVEALRGDLLERVADRPIQRTFQIVATHMPCQSEESLPAKFLLELLMDLRPTIRQAKMTVRNASIADSLPQFAI